MSDHLGLAELAASKGWRYEYDPFDDRGQHSLTIPNAGFYFHDEPSARAFLDKLAISENAPVLPRLTERLMAMEAPELRRCLAELIDNLFGYDHDEDGETLRSLDPHKEWLGSVNEDVAATLDAAGLMPELFDPSPDEPGMTWGAKP